MEPWEKHRSPHSNRHYLMNHHSFTSKQQAHAGFFGGITVCLLGKTSKDFTLPAQNKAKFC